MPKLRKMLGELESDYIQSLMRLIETQSKTTLVNWSVNYAKQHFLPIYEKANPKDARPRAALAVAQDWMDGKIKLHAAKAVILDCHAAAREAEDNPVAQAAARAIGQAASTIHAPTHSLGLAFYGLAAVCYDKRNFNPSQEELANECRKIEAALRAVAVENEPNLVKINWRC